MYEIRIYVLGECVDTFRRSNREQAKRIYINFADSPLCYTQLIVDGYPMTTAQAERYLKIGRDRYADFLF